MAFATFKYEDFEGFVDERSLPLLQKDGGFVVARLTLLSSFKLIEGDGVCLYNNENMETQFDKPYYEVIDGGNYRVLGTRVPATPGSEVVDLTGGCSPSVESDLPTWLRKVDEDTPCSLNVQKEAVNVGVGRSVDLDERRSIDAQLYGKLGTFFFFFFFRHIFYFFTLNFLQF